MSEDNSNNKVEDENKDITTENDDSMIDVNDLVEFTGSIFGKKDIIFVCGHCKGEK